MVKGGRYGMSRFLSKQNGEYIEEIASMEVCKWKINEICCNEACDCLGDYPYLPCDDIDVCGCFEKEEGLI